MKKILTLLAGMAFSLGLMAQGNWTIDKSHSKVGFVVTHMVVAEVEGSFKDFDATIVSSSDDFNGAEISFTAKTASINTENERRDNHLRSDDFFNAEQYPDIKFVGKLVKEGGKYLLKGDFTMRDVTKPVVFDVKYGGSIDTGRGMKAGFRITGTVNRLEYGLKWSNKLASGELAVADEVSINCRIELDKRS
ncbi:MAG TPA: YceI family protein [Cyclobacteriaceae bacterium]|nr:YceI family protein [Cyclobacteriaceae bacterium]